MIEANPLIRQLQIDMITDTTNPILVWFNELWSKLNIIRTDVYQIGGGEFIYYIIEDDKKIAIFYQDIKNIRFWCDYNNYWGILTNKFDLEYIDTMGITKLLVENALRNSIVRPVFKFITEDTEVDNALKYNIATPINDTFYKNGRVMNALKQYKSVLDLY